MGGKAEPSKPPTGSPAPGTATDETAGGDMSEGTVEGTTEATGG